MTGSAGSLNGVPLRSEDQAYLYSERYHPLKLVADFAAIALYDLSLVALVVWWLWASALMPELGALFDSPDAAVWNWVLVVLVALSGIYPWPRAYWIWKNTYLRVTADKTATIRKGSILWMVGAQDVAVATKRIENVNIRQTVLELVLRRLFGWDVSDVTIDTAATEDRRLHDQHYVVGAERLQAVIFAQISGS